MAELAGDGSAGWHSHTPASISGVAPHSLPEPRSPALAGSQIPSSRLSLGLGRESGFLRFFTTLLPEHEDKELFISPLRLKLAFLSRSLSPPLLSQVGGAGALLFAVAISELPHSLPPPPLLSPSPSVSQHNTEIFSFASPCYPGISNASLPKYGWDGSPSLHIWAAAASHPCHRLGGHHPSLPPVSAASL